MKALERARLDALERSDLEALYGVLAEADAAGEEAIAAEARQNIRFLTRRDALSAGAQWNDPFPAGVAARPAADLRPPLEAQAAGRPRLLAREQLAIFGAAVPFLLAAWFVRGWGGLVLAFAGLFVLQAGIVARMLRRRIPYRTNLARSGLVAAVFVVASLTLHLYADWSGPAALAGAAFGVWPLTVELAARRLQRR